MRSARRAEPEPERRAADAKIENLVLGSRLWREAPLVLTYLAHDGEVETRGLIARARAEGKRLAVPRCVLGSHELEWVEISSLQELAPGAYGIDEPAQDAPSLDPHEFGKETLAIVPGVIFDRRGQRLGNGGGYYDRFLARFPGVKVGICRRSQLVDDLSALGVIESHDVPMDVVVFPGASASEAFAH